jgi:hypothetical protein
LHPVAISTTVQIEDGQTLVTDGPFIEAKEYVGSSAPVRRRPHQARLQGIASLVYQHRSSPQWPDDPARGSSRGDTCMLTKIPAPTRAVTNPSPSSRS